MASEKVTDLTVQAIANSTDVYHVVNTTDTSQDPAGSSYKITWATLKAAVLAGFTAGTGIIISGGTISSDPTATQTLTNKTITSPTLSSPTTTGALTNNGTYAGSAVLPVANGGTGVSSLTAHGVLVGNGASTPNQPTPGTSGQVLTSNGGSADPTFQTPSSTLNTFTTTAAQTIGPGNAVVVLPYSSSVVTLDTKVSGNATGTSISQAFSVGANSNRALVVCSYLNGSSTDQTSAMSYSGSALTKIADVNCGSVVGQRVQVWYLNAPASGNNNLVITNTAADQIFYNIYSYYNVNQSGQPETNSTGTLSGAGTISATLTTAGNGRTVIGAFAGGSLTSPGGNVYTNNTATNGNLISGDSGGLFPTQTATLSATSAGGNTGAIVVSLLPIQPSFTPRAYLTNASIAATAMLTGIAQTSASPGSSVSIAVSGVDTNQSSLSIGTQYYLSNTPGAIATSAGSVSKKVGLATDTTALMIQNI